MEMETYSLFPACTRDEKAWYRGMKKKLAGEMDEGEQKDFNAWQLALRGKYTHLYGRTTDEQMLEMIRWYTRQLGHAPSKAEVFPPYRIFIKQRFKKWNTALRAAGVRPPKRNGSGRQDGEKLQE